MRIFKLVLISFFLITSANSNSIYNLIKIPNLEIYELKTPNKLKYFYAIKPFRLGVQKNIACSNSDKKTYDEKYQIISNNLKKYSKEFLRKINLKYIVMCENLSISGINTAGIPDHVMKTLIIDLRFNKKYQIISKNLNRYSKEFLKKINLKYIVMCENLSISGINTAGIPDHTMKTLIIDLSFNEKYFERVIHHELFHIINDGFKELFDDDEWKKFNEPNFKYADCSTCSKK